MKKLIALIITLIIACIGILFWNFTSYKQEPLPIQADADFYIVHTNAISAYRLNGDTIETLKSTKMWISDQIAWRSARTVDQRYLIMSEDGVKSFGESLIKLDFQDATIQRRATRHFSHVTGTDGKYFYTNDYGQLTKFDNDLKEVKAHVFKEDHFPEQNINVYKDKIYMTGSIRTSKPGEDWTAKNVLFIFDKENLDLLDTVEIDQDLSTINSQIVGDKLYLPIAAYQEDQQNFIRSYDIAVFQLDTLDMQKITLDTHSPEVIHPIEDQDLLFIEHSSYEHGQLLATIYDTKTGQESLHDFSQFDPDGSYWISSVKQVDAERLVITIGDHLLLYNWKTKTVLSQVRTEFEAISGLWWANN
ncbi:hypothetical protein JN540_00680 [Streptococcus suis]|nr:hypothetical protein [Streptococcus suis]